MMWSCGSVLEGRKDGSGFTLSALRVRRKLDLWRQDWQIHVDDDFVDEGAGRSARLEKMEAMAAAALVVA